MSADRSFAEEVYRLVRRIPRGRVSTYGAIAALLGRPRAARAVGQAMRHCPANLPWHRVLNARGGISRRTHGSGALGQKIRLEQEGITLHRGRVRLSIHGWTLGSALRTRVSRARVDIDALDREMRTRRSRPDHERRAHSIVEARFTSKARFPKKSAGEPSAPRSGHPRPKPVSPPSLQRSPS